MLFLNIKERTKKKTSNKSNYNNSNKTELNNITRCQRVIPV